MHNVASVEDGYQALDRSLRATRSRRNVFPEDESGVLNGPNENVLIWTVHKGGQLSKGSDIKISCELAASVRNGVDKKLLQVGPPG